MQPYKGTFSSTPPGHFNRNVIPTIVLDNISQFNPPGNSLYLHGSTDESRAGHFTEYLNQLGIVTVFLADAEPTIDEQKAFSISIGDEHDTISLYNGREQDGLWDALGAELVYLDITGLPHHIWAPLIASAHRNGQELQVIYVEPAEYRRSKNAAQRYDLSDAIQGIRPLPGFTSLQPTGDNVCYVPLLGFEGVRFSYATTTIDPPSNKTFPIIGLPGFRPEYPFETYLANQRSLESDNGQTLLHIKYVDASCPFSLFYTLEKIHNDNRGDILKIALLGTKPHALGAALYSIHKDSNKVQLIYDYPKRKIGRTSGTGRIYIYHVSLFLAMVNSPI